MPRRVPCKTPNNQDRFFSYCTHYLERSIRHKLPRKESKNNRMSFAYSVFADVRKGATIHYPEHFLHKDTLAKLQNSICHSMEAIRNRTLGSQKGLMYSGRFFEEVVNGNEENAQKHLAFREHSGIKSPHPFFKLDGRSYYRYITKTGVSPSGSLRAFLEGPTLADCGTTVEAVYLQAMFNSLGKQKFDSLFASRRDKLKIGAFVSWDIESSLDCFTELVDPRVNNKTDLNKLQIGDHICLRGVPGYGIKHRLGNWANLHALVVGFNKEGNPLLSGLGLSEPATPTEITNFMIDAYNEPQSSETKELIQEIGEDVYYHPQRLQQLMGTHSFSGLDKSYFFKPLSYDNARSMGAGEALNYFSCRLSPYVMSVLRATPASENLAKEAHKAKTLLLAHQWVKLKEFESV